MSESVLFEVEGHVGTITLNRPERRNALSFEMRERLAQGLEDFAANAEVRIVVLEGAPPSFCAGVDLSEASPTPDHVVADAPVSVSAPFAAFSKPLFASVNGTAAGGGLEIALACDFIVASTSAKFMLPEVRIGSIPGAGGTQRLVRAIPSAVAARMLYTGDALSAESALNYGLVTELVEPDKLHDRALELAHQIASNAPLSLAAIKECLRAATNSALEVGLTLERGLWRQLTSSEDRAEGRAAFREGRPAQFKGK
ncbi:MAG TPA: enoyl-CoA hydratase/isomerase family protein [Acidimicrobiales bacterium]|nr:enoyl-CoA hydratase/isomerase family protein [Acidimicrobiales bacterium]